MTMALSRDAVARLQQRQVAAVEAQLDEAVGGMDVDADKRAALRRFALTGLKRNRQVKLSDLRRHALGSVASIDAAAARITDPMPTFSRAVFRTAGFLRGSKARYGDFFGGEDRLYYPLEADIGPIERRVAAALATEGYRILDYAGNRATDAAGKQQFRIGKLLAGISPEVYEQFQHDGNRTAGEVLLVLSRDPLDVARMSTGRSWTSCMDRDGMYWEKVKYEVQRGTLVAYMIAADDPDIVHPLARVLLKPYRGPNGARRLLAERAYGMGGNDAFQARADALAQEISAGAPHGRYNIDGWVYNDRLPESVLHVDPTMPAEDFLRAVHARVLPRPNGELFVQGDLHIASRFLERLPDLSRVTVQGDFVAYNNRLTALEGMPQRIGGAVILEQNRLTDLRGLPAALEGSLDISNNQLTSLDGAPRHVAGNFDCSHNRLASLAGGPRHVAGEYNAAANVLATLEGGPARVDATFRVEQNLLRRLDGLPGSWWRLSSDLGNFDRLREIPAALLKPLDNGKATKPGPEARPETTRRSA